MSRLIQINAKYSLGFKKYLASSKSTPLSFIHDLSLNASPQAKTVDMVVEIPRYEQGKFEISKELAGNPIVQDTKKGKLRFINNIFPFAGYPVNYGALPQTWEDPSLGVEIDGKTVYGDNDPLDVCEIGDEATFAIGQQQNVKVLGCLAMIDDGELDYKLLTISSNHRLASKLNSPEDVEKELPGLLSGLQGWLRDYKLPMGKPQNEFGFEGKWLGQDKAWEVISECHHRWQMLVNGEVTGDSFPSIENYTLNSTPGFKITSENDILVNEDIKDEEIPIESKHIYYYKN